MRTASGLERLLLHETNVCDLIQFFASEDPKPLAALLGINFDDVQRESQMGDNRADLVFYQAGLPVAAIEVKIAHTFDEVQQRAYERWAKATGATKLVLASLDSAPADLPTEWKHYPLPGVFAAWTSDRESPLFVFASRVANVLQGWGRVIDGVRRPLTEAGALTFADVDNVALLRVISRELSIAQRAAGFNAQAGVTSGGGNPIAQSWTEVEGVANVCFIADARFEDERIHLRFGVDGGRSTESDVWRVARALDEAITIDAFAKFIDRPPYNQTGDLARFGTSGRDRPQARGDWNAVITAAKVTAGTNPGFLRDGLTRLECGGRISKNHANSWSLELLMQAVHEHLQAAWAATSGDPTSQA